MVLKPQDVLVALHVALLQPSERFVFADVARSLGLSKSEVHSAIGRGLHAKLISRSLRRIDSEPVANRANLLEFLLHGVRYAFPAQVGRITRGMPTGYASPVLREYFAPSSELPPVWPDPAGATRGREFEPLYASAPKAAAANPRLYAALALVDAIRGGSARDREIGARLLTAMLQGKREHADERQPRHP